MNKLSKICCLLFVLAAAPAQAQQALPSFADLVERLLPSVVNISTQNLPTGEETDLNALENTTPSLSDYFKKPEGNQTSLGSGFIIDEQGHIITNNHVIENASEISITLADNRQFPAQVIGRDLKTDIALLKISPNTKLTPVKFGNADKIRVGDWILAIGNPFGLGGSVTAGIVSAKSRDIAAGPYDNFIQTDASINQGSSGGPMFNLSGEVIGINTAIFSTNGGSMGIGFAIPINSVDYVIAQLKESGQVQRGWIGVKIQPTTEEIRTSLGLSGTEGVIVSEVEPNSPAAKAGVEVGDIILSFDDQKIDNTKNLSQIVARTAVGKKTSLNIWRQKAIKRLPVTVELLTELPAPEPQKTISAPQIEQSSDTISYSLEEIGLTLAPVNASTADKFSISPTTTGIVITKIKSGSEAEIKGLKAGDIITKADNKDIYDIKTLKDAFAEAALDNNRPVLLQINDNGVFHFAAIKGKQDAKN